MANVTIECTIHEEECIAYKFEQVLIGNKICNCLCETTKTKTININRVIWEIYFCKHFKNKKITLLDYRIIEFLNTCLQLFICKQIDNDPFDDFYKHYCDKIKEDYNSQSYRNTLIHQNFYYDMLTKTCGEIKDKYQKLDMVKLKLYTSFFKLIQTNNLKDKVIGWHNQAIEVEEEMEGRKLSDLIYNNFITPYIMKDILRNAIGNLPITNHTLRNYNRILQTIDYLWADDEIYNYVFDKIIKEVTDLMKKDSMAVFKLFNSDPPTNSMNKQTIKTAIIKIFPYLEESRWVDKLNLLISTCYHNMKLCAMIKDIDDRERMQRLNDN